ncbi:thioesterase domain-containing protein [Streptomyces albulus]|nr:thioesterase domain-containing protein [Streptomyces noursei]
MRRTPLSRNCRGNLTADRLPVPLPGPALPPAARWSTAGSSPPAHRPKEERDGNPCHRISRLPEGRTGARPGPPLDRRPGHRARPAPAADLPAAGGRQRRLVRALAPRAAGRVELATVELPGRGVRSAERLPDTLEELADAVIDGIRDEFDQPYALFGHSFGALLGYEIAVRIARRGLPSPRALLVSAARAPHTRCAGASPTWTTPNCSAGWTGSAASRPSWPATRRTSGTRSARSAATSPSPSATWLWGRPGRLSAARLRRRRRPARQRCRPGALARLRRGRLHAPVAARRARLPFTGASALDAIVSALP